MNTGACMLCGSTDRRRLFLGRDRNYRVDAREFPVAKCSRCGLVFLDPQPPPQELNRYYPDTYNPYQDDDATFRYGPVARLVKRAIGIFRSKASPSSVPPTPDESEKTYLDFGCGGGFQLKRLRDAHPRWKLFGLDNNPTACRRARELGFEVFCDDAVPSSLPHGAFDLVRMNHVIEHLPDPRATLERIRRSMKPCGALTVSTPNAGSLAARMFRSRWYALDTPRHLFLFDPRTLSRLLSETGYRVHKIEFDSGPKAFIRSVYHLFGRKDMAISPITWSLLLPFSRLAARFGLTSHMTIEAEADQSSTLA